MADKSNRENDYTNFNNTIKSFFPEFEDISGGFTGRESNFVQQEMNEMMNLDVFVLPDGNRPMDAFLSIEGGN